MTTANSIGCDKQTLSHIHKSHATPVLVHLPSGSKVPLKYPGSDEPRKTVELHLEAQGGGTKMGESGTCTHSDFSVFACTQLLRCLVRVTAGKVCFVWCTSFFPPVSLLSATSSKRNLWLMNTQWVHAWDSVVGPDFSFGWHPTLGGSKPRGGQSLFQDLRI